MIPRRQFLSTTTLAFLALQRYSLAAPSKRVIEPHGPLIPDPQRILDLPKGFSYRVISKVGTRMSDGFKVPGKPDGMAAFPGPDGKVILVRNHELPLTATKLGPFENHLMYPGNLDPALSHDPGKGGNKPYFGGTTNLVFDPASGEIVSEFLSLTGTDRNCAGGAMPWGSWITCEETDNLTRGRGRHHGWCFEVKATATPGLQKATALKALGRFRHEAVALDPETGILYLTEDRSDGLLYRFIPDKQQDFTSGKLQALAIVDKPKADLRNYSSKSRWPVEGKEIKVTWIDLEDTHAPQDDLRVRGHDAGAARFARGEGIHHTPEGIFICCTDGGPSRRGQLFLLQPSGSAEKPDTLSLFLQSEKDDLLTNGDNLCPAPWGGLVVCEDLIDVSFAEHSHVQCVTPEGKIHTLARNAKDKSEFAGCCFSPGGKWLFVNLFAHGLTLAITGPWSV
ncbi:alkaline phosphatase PhoX [Haloferula chungangensis]|uniref:Alkaline phosphatase PhoX n=1 Tax=Haloferula chungangensis TaxID=1048331 RepID=A0ABW2LCI5_9BACT